jgi:hypothetical protein
MPVPTFTKRNKTNTSAALDGTKPLAALKPAEWHQYVQHYNFDDGVEPFAWLVDQPTLDQGTALLLYWLLQPDYWHGLTAQAAAGQDEPAASLVTQLEQHFTGGFYTSARFAFDPAAEFVTADTKTEGIPPVMLQPTPGEPFPRLELATVFLRGPNQKEQAAISRHLTGAKTVLQQAGQAADAARPAATVEAISQAVEHFKQAGPGKVKVAELNWLWLDCLGQAYNWEWAAWDWETGASVGAVNPARTMFCNSKSLISHTLEGLLKANTIVKLFRELGGATKPKDLKDGLYTSMGLVTGAGHLPYHQ